MFKLFQNIMGSEPEETKQPNGNSHQSSALETSSSLAAVNSTETTSISRVGQELLGQQGRLKESIGAYDRAIAEDSDSLSAYEELLSHLKQQNSVAEAYKKLANSLHKQGKDNEAASCYRQAIVIEAVTTEAKGKYKDSSLPGKLAEKSTPANLDLSNDAFSFRGSIEAKPQPVNVIQIELPLEYIPNLSVADRTRQLDSRKIATVEWEAAQTCMQKALECSEREEWLEVAKACQQATKIAPEMAEAYKIWGNALQRMNRTAEAMECYGKAVEIQPDLGEVYAAIANLYAQQQKWHSATEYYQKAIIIKPEFPKAYRSLASVWEQLGEATKARVCRHRARELETKMPSIDPSENATDASKLSLQKANSVSAYRQLAEASENASDWEAAALYYRKALELNAAEARPTVSPEANRHDKSQQLTKLQTIKAAIINQHVETDKTSALATMENRAFSFDTRTVTSTVALPKSWEEALASYKKQAKLNPNSAEVQIEIGNLYAKKKKWQQALASYSKAIRINPKEAEAHTKLAKILGKTGNHASYVEHMYIAYTIDPNLGSAEDHFMLGNAIRKMGHRNRAIVCYEQAIRLQPHYLEAYLNLAEVYKQIGKGQNAASCYKAAIRHNPQNADLYYRLGDLLASQAAWDEAVAAYRAVLELQPKYPQASQKLNHALSNKLQRELAGKRRR